MSRRFTATIRALCIIALLLSGSGFLHPQVATAATPGGMFSWGADDNGTLCLGSLTTRQTTPQPAVGAASGDVVAVAAGGYYSLLLKANGTIFACGNNRYYGMLGIGTEDSGNHPTPQQVTGVSGATAIAAGVDHNLAVAGGNVYTWGRNAHGELGQGTTDTAAHPTPTVIAGFGDVRAVAGGRESSFAIKTDGTLWSWGNNNAGQLGLGATGDRTTPQQVFLAPSVPLLAQSVASGDQTTAVVATDGKVYTFGRNGIGELGNGTTDSLPHPTPTQIGALGTNNTAVVAGYQHTLVLKGDGTAWGWGIDNIGQLGRGTATTVGCGCQPTPAAVAGLAGALALGSGQQASSALLSDGTIRTWGSGASGQLGNGSQGNSASPVAVSGLTNAVALSNGPYAQQNLAIKVTPPPTTIVSVSPLALQYPNQPLNVASAPKAVRLSNSGTQPLLISTITMVGTNPGDFTQTNDCGTTVAPTASCTIAVTFNPTAVGQRTATMQISDNAATGPQQVSLSGTGLDVPPPFNLTVTFAGAGSGTVAVDAAGITQPTPNHYLVPRGNVATLTAQGGNNGFIAWKIDGIFVGWANPITLTMNTDHTMEATFVPPASFGDVPAGQSYTDAVLQLAARDIIRGCVQDTTPKEYCPADITLRAQMAALIARSSGWDLEDHTTPFPDQGIIDGDLWRNVGTVAFYNVARGYPDGTYNPTGEVLHAQTISFITRAMVTKAYWNLQPDDGSYPNVPGGSGHRQDIATFVHYAGAVPGSSNTGGDFDGWDQPSSRGWFARVLWQTLNSYFGADQPGSGGYLP